MAEIRATIDREGYEAALSKAPWPRFRHPVERRPALRRGPFLGLQASDSDLGFQGGALDDDTDTGTEDPFNYSFCLYYPTDPECRNSGAELKKDGIQFVTLEVLYQTLAFFKVQHKLEVTKNGGYRFTLKDSPGAVHYLDLDTAAVVQGMKQFRRYLMNLLCDNPSVANSLKLMQRYDVGLRFRWEMAWVLLGNELPGSPNRYMAFGPRWRKFSDAVNAISTGTSLSIPRQDGGFGVIQASEVVPQAGRAKIGFIAREVIGILQLVGDIVTQILDLFCVVDLSTKPEKEQKKQLAVYETLKLKKKVYEHYPELKSVLEEVGEQAARITGRPQQFTP